MNVLRLIPLVIAWLPHAIAAVTVIEAVIGPSKTGAEKKKLVLDYLRSTSLKLGLPWGDSAIKAIELAIDAIVGIMNFIGQFRHAADEEPEVAAAAAVVANVRNAFPAASTALEDDAALTAFKHQMRLE